MFKKMKLKKEIEQSKQKIAELEQKRARSQAALVEAILLKTEPKDDDVDFFNKFTEQIEEERQHMHDLMKELDALNK
ncbi:MAG: hypothetical protein IKZ81_03065 [Clostridia bacterium]|nr:hypothetical protein [Clostridia bacterium]MBR4439162.1 hypothetical protein [Clostridia bacterium]MBR5768565.1 hypothetical protein [Clostridia bacterium]MBR5942301.1 hypothetical protein [Clostridia bacterium]